MPELFSGKLEKTTSSLTQCSLVFWQQPRTYESKTAYFVQLLCGQALKQAQAVLKENSEITFFNFQTKFWAVFNKSSNPSAHCLMSLKQGRQSIADFSEGFWILAEELGWEEKALCKAFLHTLSDGLKGEVASKDLPSLLGEEDSPCMSAVIVVRGNALLIPVTRNRKGCTRQ